MLRKPRVCSRTFLLSCRPSAWAKLGYLGSETLHLHYSLRANPETKVWINAQVRGPAESLRQVQFATLDLMRRAQGHALGAVGFDSIESPHRRLASGDTWRLRDYGGTSLLVVVVVMNSAQDGA